MPILTLQALNSSFTALNFTTIDTFSSVRNGTESTNTFTTNPVALESSQNPASTFTINRAGIPFPAIVPHGVKVNHTTLRIYVDSILNNDDCTLYVVQASYDLPPGKRGYSAISFTKLGQVSFESLFVEQYNDIVISPQLNYNGTIKPYLITNLDFGNISPTVGVNRVEIEDGSSANPPQLILDVAYLKRAASNSLMMTGKGV